MPRAKGSPHRAALEGQRFNRWTVLSRVAGSMWHCRCDCSKEAFVSTSGLKMGKSKSCGCLKTELQKTHGLGRSSIYYAWAGMIQRCENPKSKWYHRYGGRGIKVCKEWREDFLTFYADMGDKPEGLELDRIDNDGDYSKANCRWATRTEQIRNRITTKHLTFNGETLPLPEWAKKLGMSRKVLERRIRDEWTTEKALSTPKSGRWGIISNS